MRKLMGILCALLMVFAAAWAEDVQGIEITLSREIFYTGTRYTVQAEIRYDESVTGEIAIVNGAGETVAVVENDGSGNATVELKLGAAVPGDYMLTGVCGDITGEACVYTVLARGASVSQTVGAESAPVQERTAQEKAATLYGVGEDIVRMLQENNIEDAASDEANRLVCEMLAADERISAYGMNNGNVLFQTVDGLLGCYGLHRTAGEISAGETVFLDLNDAYVQFAAGKLEADTVVESGIPVTNSNILLVHPDAADETMNFLYLSYDPILQAMAQRLDHSYRAVTGEDAFNTLAAGDITDCGLLILLGHGGQLLTHDSYMYVMTLGDITPEQTERVADMLWMPTEVGTFDRYHRETDDPEDVEYSFYVTDEAHLIFAVSQGENGDFAFKMGATRMFFESVLADKKFDNTVIFMASCFGASDQRLREFMFERGASALIGTMNPMKNELSVCMVQNLSNMTVKKEDGTYMGLHEAVTTASSAQTREFLTGCYNMLTGLGYIDAEEQSLEAYLTEKESIFSEEWENNPMLLFTSTADVLDRVWADTGTVSGCVTATDGQPVPDAEVYLYRWGDHTFREEAEEQVVHTDAEGRYCFEEIPYAQYAVKAMKDGAEGYATCAVDADACQADAIILMGRQIVVTMEIEYIDDEMVTGFIMKPQVHLTGGGEAEAMINAKLEAIHQDTLKVVEDYRGQSLMGGRHSMELWVEDVSTVGSFLYITYGERRMTSGAARSMSWTTAVSFDTVTGGTIELENVIPEEDGKLAQLVALIEQQLQEKYAQNLDVSPETAAEYAVTNTRVTWSLDMSGLHIIYPADWISPRFVGDIEIVLPFASLEGILDDAYIPAPLNGSGSAEIVQGAGTADFGTTGGYTLTSAGTIDRVKVTSKEGYLTVVVFYADVLNGQTALLPEAEAFTLSYYSEGDQIIK